MFSRAPPWYRRRNWIYVLPLLRLGGPYKYLSLFQNGQEGCVYREYACVHNLGSFWGAIGKVLELLRGFMASPGMVLRVHGSLRKVLRALGSISGGSLGVMC